VQNLQNLIPANSGYQLSAVAINDNGQIIAATTTTTETNPTTTGGHAVLLTPNWPSCPGPAARIRATARSRHLGVKQPGALRPLKASRAR
jgi:hypothetical protein